MDLSLDEVINFLIEVLGEEHEDQIEDILEEMIIDGDVEKFKVDGVIKYRLTAIGQASREALINGTLNTTKH